MSACPAATRPVPGSRSTTIPLRAPSRSKPTPSSPSSCGNLAITPRQPALHFFDQTISKGQLLRYADGFAAALAASGVQRGDRVALYLQNVPEFVVALLGIWRMGAIAVPVNPMNKQRELQLILEDSGASSLVCMADLLSVVEAVREPIDVSRRFVVHTSDRPPLTESRVDGPRIEPPLVGQDETEFWSEVRAGATATAQPDAVLVPEDPACLTYTSGTTGPPKGAVNTHQKMLFSSRTFERWMELDEDDVILGIAPFFHITGLVGHVTTALVSGAALIVLGRFRRRSPSARRLATARRSPSGRSPPFRR
jgi:long-chain acyl-CoA synthetase